MSLTASSDFSGEATIELKNSICAEAIGTRHVLDDEVCLVNPNPEPTLPGDINGDGLVDVGDVTRLISLVLNDVTDDEYDLNGDGLVDVGDVTRLIGMVLSN